MFVQAKAWNGTCDSYLSVRACGPVAATASWEKIRLEKSLANCRVTGYPSVIG